MRLGWWGVSAVALLATAPPAIAQTQVASAEKSGDEAQSDDVVVTGLFQGTDGGVLGARSPLDLPFNQSAYDAELLQNQMVRTLSDVILNDPSVRQVEPQGSTVDYYTIRGFQVQQADLAINGLFGLFEGARPGVEGFERIEILKGPSALIFGFPPRGSIGGTVNQIPKRAGDRPLTSATLSYISEGQIGGHVDVGRRFGADNRFGLRVNAACRDGDTEVDLLNIEFCMASAALDYRGDRLKASLDVAWSKQDIRGYQLGYLPIPGQPIPRAPDATTSGSQSWLRGRDRQWYALGRLDYEATDDIDLYATYGRSRITEYFLTVYPAVITNAGGNFTASVNELPSLLTAWSGEVGIRAAFGTGPIAHRLSVSGNNQERKSYYDYVGRGTFDSNIYDPVRVPEIVTTDLTALFAGKSRATSVAVVDTLSAFDEKLQVIAGARHQWLSDEYRDIYTQQRSGGYKKSKTSPMLGVVVRPSDPVSVYANYVEGLQAGFQVAPPAENAGQVFAPLTSKQIEAGVKYQRGGTELGVAVFQLERPFTVNRPGQTAGGFVTAVDGLQRHRGVELYGSIRPVENLKLLGGATYMDGRQARTQDGTNDGRKAIGVPDWQVNLYAEYGLPALDGVTVTGRYLYTSSSRVFADTDQTIPGWSRVDLGARYGFDLGSTRMTARANVENLFDDSHYLSAVNSTLVLDAPRTFVASLSIEL